MKSLLRTSVAALLATLVAFVLAPLAIILNFDGDSAAPSGLFVLGARLGAFFVLSLLGFGAVRLLLRGGRSSLALYLAAGLVVGAAAAALTVAVVQPGYPVRLWVLGVGALAGLAGALPLSGRGSEPARLKRIDEAPPAGG